MQDNKLANEQTINELNLKKEKLEESNKELKEDLKKLKDEINSKKEEVDRLNEEEKYYSGKIEENLQENRAGAGENDALVNNKNELSEKGKENTDNPESKNDRSFHMHELLYEVVDDYQKKIFNYSSVKEEYSNPKIEPLFFNYICIVLVEGDMSTTGNNYQTKYQTFRIKQLLTFAKIKDICLELWDQKELKDEYCLKLFDNEIFSEIKEEWMEIDAFFKSRSNIKKPKFALINKHNKAKPEDIINPNEIKKQSNVESDNPNNNVLSTFTVRVIGLKTTILETFDKILKKQNSNKKPVVLEKSEIIMQNLPKVLMFLNLVIFLIFSIISLSNMNNVESSFIMNQSLINQFKINLNNPITDIKDLKQNILNLFDELFYDPKKGFSLINIDNVIPGAIQIGFYSSKSRECSEFEKNKWGDTYKCYTPLYENYEGNVDDLFYITANQYKNEKELFPDDFEKEFAKKNYFVMGTDNQNFIRYMPLPNSPYENLFTYLQQIYKTFYDAVTIESPCTGRLGTYSQTYMTIWLSASYISKSVADLILDILLIKADLFSKGLRSVRVDFNLYNYQTGTFYYFNILYEFPYYGGFLRPSYSITPFKLNPWLSSTGKIVFILEIIQMIQLIVIMIDTALSFSKEKNKQTESNTNAKSLLKIIANPRISWSVIVILLQLIVFIIKMSSLNIDPNTIIYSSSDNNNFIEQNKTLFSFNAFSFERAQFIQSIIVLILLGRILLEFDFYKRINVFHKYLGRSMTVVIQYFFMIAFILLGHSIFANNLWGQYSDSYRDLASSITSTMLFGIGHYDSKIFKINVNWSIIFTLTFFLLNVYFISNTFVGIYLESYRITSLKKGYIYDLSGRLKLKSDDKKKK